jgi:hypothetical protein
MINVKKGPAHSLGQSDLRGAITSNTGTVIAGALCYLANGTTYNSITPAAGSVALAGGAAAVSATQGCPGIRGFAINSITDGDVIESGKLALYLLDGQSIIETDQVDYTGDSGTLTATTYPIGTPLYQSQTAAGKVSKLTSGTPGPVIGYVEGIRYLQLSQPGATNASAGTQSYTSATEAAAYNAANASGATNFPVYTATTGTASFKPQTNVAVLAIKLASGN